MKAVKTLSLLMVGLVVSSAAWAGKYGDAVLEEGKMTVLEQGKKPVVYTASNKSITINMSDVIRMGDNSRVKINTGEKAEVTLGANAIMHVQPWNQRQKAGNMRMLFGRFRAKVSGLVTGEQFNVKTATATIGVKGTEYIAIVSSNGNTTMIPVENVVQLEGLDGLAQDVTPGQISVVVNGQRASAPTKVPGKIHKELTNEKLASPGVESNRANLLPGEVSLLNAGIINEDLLMESKIEEFTLEQALLKPIGEIESLEKEGRSFSKEAQIK
ncbi:MAG: FecR family protein [Deltaproteobacteria bacterium]|nr:FecR family protein [Deltaproteobacteria bacterium]